MGHAIALAAALLLGAAAAPAALAQATYPTRAVRIVVAYPPGGGIDVMARQLAERLTPQWGQPVVVENRPGGSTIPATELVAKSPADGHTILLTTDSTFSINPHLFAKLPYSDRDFVAVTQLILLQQLLLANPSLPANNLTELVALARAKPGTLNYGSYGSGSQPHLAAETLKARAGIDIVPYKGLSLSIPAAIAGEVQLTFSGIASSRAQVQAGRLKALAIGGPRRSPLMPDVPTFAEQGYPEVETHAWFGLFVPAGTPRATVDRIYRDVAAILIEPGFREKEVVQKGYDLVASSPEEFAAFIVRDREARGRAVKISGAKAE
jgi:tripartite-type tricarboxylate transporter receptor subunit TctC